MTIESVPPEVTEPHGEPSVTAPPWSMSRVMAMISDSNLVALGHMSRWSTLTWAKGWKAWVRNS
ncbi:MAG: hypothetical protein R2726_19415 [Acidimicrobiales bacterium]